MSDKSKIEWTDATWNPVTGCSKVSQGCKHCYALRDWKRLSANPKSVYYGREFTDVECHHERLDQPLRWRKPRRIFVNSMSDLFHESVPDHFIAEVFAYMAYSRQHVFQVLTKRPERMRDLLSWGADKFDTLMGSAMMVASCDAEEILGRRGEFDPNERRTDDIRAYDPPWPLPNVWLGVSVEDQATADERIPLLLETPAAVRWISAEPLLGPINLTRLHPPAVTWLDALGGREHFGCGVAAGGAKLDWCVAGGESGPNARPSHPHWFELLRDQCAAASVPFHFKQWGEWRPAVDGAELEAFEERLVIRTVSEDEKKRKVYWPDGTFGGGSWNKNGGPGWHLLRVGKKNAGRLLDGREHNELPAQGGSRA